MVVGEWPVRVFVREIGEVEIHHGGRAKIILHGFDRDRECIAILMSPDRRTASFAPRRAPATHRHARDSAGRPGAGRGGMNGNKEGRASRADGRGRNGSRGQSALGLWAAGGEAGSF